MNKLLVIHELNSYFTMNKLTEKYFALSGHFYKNAYRTLSICLIILGTWVCFFPSDLSRRAGIAQIVAGIFFGIAYFNRKRKLKK